MSRRSRRIMNDDQEEDHFLANLKHEGPLDEDLTELVLSNKGGPKLIHQGYMYTLHKKQPYNIRWRCVGRSLHCHGSLVTAVDGKKPRVRMEHNHNPDLNAAQMARRKYIALGQPQLLQGGRIVDDVNPIRSNAYQLNFHASDNPMEAPPVLPTQSKDGSMKTIKVATQSFVRQMRQVTPQQSSQVSQQRQPKTLVLKTIPLKVKQVSPTTIRMPPRQPGQSSQTSQVTSHNVTPQQPTEVCLRWNSYHSNMQNSFPSLLDSEEFVDVTLACEGRSLKCHKMILSSCSDYLAALLRENPCQHPIILMKDLKFWEVEALVKFMYRGEVNVAHDKLPQLLNAAEALQVKGLAGPSPSSQPRTPVLQPLSTRSNDQVQTKDGVIKASTSSSSAPSSPKRGHKRQNSESDVGVFTKIRLLNPRSPSSPNPTVKSEPLDIPLSPTEIFPEDDNDREDGSNPASNFDMVHDDDDPGGDEGEAFCGPADLNDSEDQMEFVPTDFLDQEQDIVEEQDTNCSLDDDNKEEKDEKEARRDTERGERDKRERKDEREKDTKSGIKEKSHARKDKRLT